MAKAHRKQAEKLAKRVAKWEATVAKKPSGPRTFHRKPGSMNAHKG